MAVGVGVVGEAGKHDVRMQKKFGAQRSELGNKGEQLTSAQLDAVIRSRPQAAVFHRIKLPKRRGVDVDHVIVAGTTVVVIDSKLWKGGTYWRVGPYVFRGLSYYKPASKTSLGFEVAELKKLLPRKARLRAFVAAWGGKKRIFCRAPGGHPIVPGGLVANRVVAMLPEASPDPEILSAMLRLAGSKR
jgi:hypothetical protein